MSIIVMFAVFVEHPHSINAVDGTEVQFSCIARNGTSASEQSVIDKCFWIMILHKE